MKIDLYISIFQERELPLVYDRFFHDVEFNKKDVLETIQEWAYLLDDAETKDILTIGRVVKEKITDLIKIKGSELKKHKNKYKYITSLVIEKYSEGNQNGK